MADSLEPSSRTCMSSLPGKDTLDKNHPCDIHVELVDADNPFEFGTGNDRPEASCHKQEEVATQYVHIDKRSRQMLLLCNSHKVL